MVALSASPTDSRWIAARLDRRRPTKRQVETFRAWSLIDFVESINLRLVVSDGHLDLEVRASHDEWTKYQCSLYDLLWEYIYLDELHECTPTMRDLVAERLEALAADVRTWSPSATRRR